MTVVDPFVNVTVTLPSDVEKGTVLALAVCDASDEPKIENNDPGASGGPWKLAEFTTPPDMIVGGVFCAEAKAANDRRENAQVRIKNSS